MFQYYSIGFLAVIAQVCLFSVSLTPFHKEAEGLF